MNRWNLLLLAAYTCVSVTTRHAGAQGGLTPSGPPGPTMKTLDQVEPRFVVTNAPVTISQPGSYYLVTNLSGTVTIASDNVTLDLMGFRIRPLSGNGITVSGARSNLDIGNGTLEGGVYGVDASALTSGLSRFHDLVAAGNSADGMLLGAFCFVRDCVSVSNKNDGISLGDGGVWNCLVQGNGGNGISVNHHSRLEGNHVTLNVGSGIKVTGNGVHVTANFVGGNGQNYNFAAGNLLNLLICQIPETLSWPCSVRLAGTFAIAQLNKDGVTVASDNVTIDMAGHALIGPGQGTGHGIYMPATNRNLRVHNGKVVGWNGAEPGSGGINPCGIAAMGTGVILEDLQAFTNCCGIVAGAAPVIARCTSHGNSSDGIKANLDAAVTDCTSSYNGGTGFTVCHSALNHCVANDNGGNGIFALGSSVSFCTASGNLVGIWAAGMTTLTDSAANMNKNEGIYVGDDCRVANSVCSHNGTSVAVAGISLGGYRSTVERNHVSQNNGAGMIAGFGGTAASDNRIDGNNCVGNTGPGIQIVPGMFVANNVVIRNTAHGNGGGNYPVPYPVGNFWGGIVNIGLGVATTDPWANVQW